MDISIVGAGYAGLLSAIKIKDVKIFEENKYVGIPPHCTGLVSYVTVNYLGDIAREVITNEFKGLAILDSAYKELFYLKPYPKIVRLDRIKLEELMKDQALNNGSIINLRQRVIGINFNRSKYSLVVNRNGNIEDHQSDFVIVAEGASQGLSVRLGLARRHRKLFLGFQGYADAGSNMADYTHNDTIVILLNDKYFKDFFGWIIPVSRKKVLIGVGLPIVHSSKLHKGNSYSSVINALIADLYRNRFISSRTIRKSYGGLIIRNAPSTKHFRYRAISIGDAMGMVKPFSGGGLYTIAYQIEILSKLIHRYMYDYESLWNRYRRYIERLISQLKSQEMLSNLLSRIGLEAAFKMLSSMGIVGGLETFDFEHHFEYFRNKIMDIFRGVNLVRFK